MILIAKWILIYLVVGAFIMALLSFVSGKNDPIYRLSFSEQVVFLLTYPFLIYLAILELFRERGN